MTPVQCGIVPPYLLERLARVDDPAVAAGAQRTLAHDSAMRERRTVMADRASRDSRRSGMGLVPPALTERIPALDPRRPTVSASLPVAVHREIHDAGHARRLPGRLVRAEQDAPVADVAVNEAYDGLGATWDLLWSAYGRDSLDGKGLELLATVHFGVDYDNAFWDGAQMVFGDGDGDYFRGFTSSVDVIGHELAHGLTQFTAGLTYVGQSGALNESISDVVGSLVKQRLLGQRAEEADWLIGADLFTDRVHGEGLRSMRAPGTAYDDPVLGRDPQPGHMRDFVELPHDGDHDNGGVHTNSGIPNHAFCLAALAVGGPAWETVGWVWFDAITAKGVPKDVDFAGFAHLTILAAQRRFGADHRVTRAVRDGWDGVGVAPSRGSAD